MKLWESISDKAHDFARWVKGWGKKDAQNVNDAEMNWSENPMFEDQNETSGEEVNPLFEPMPEPEPAPEPEPEPAVVFGQSELRSMDRKVLDRSVVENTRDYDKVGRSSSVKKLMRNIKAYHKFMAKMKIPKVSGSEQEFMNKMAKVNGMVVSRMQEMQDYLARKAQGYALKTKEYRGMMEVCAQEAMKIRTQMDYVLKIQENCFYHLRTEGNVPYSGLSYEQVLNSNDLNIFQEKDSTERTYLGGGQMNTIYTMEDTARDNQIRALKEGNASLDISGNTTESNTSLTLVSRLTHGNTGGKSRYTLNTAYRDVAVSIIDKLFNLNAAVETTFARSKRGQQSTMMDVAKGATADDIYTYTDETSKKEANLLKQIAVNEEALVGEESPESKKSTMKAQKRKFINTGSAKFIESTFNLAALDIIVGHVDRHQENMMVSEEGVRGIDNDMAFGVADVMELGKDHKDFTYDEILQKMMVDGAEKINTESQAFLFLDTQFSEVTEEFRQKILHVPPSAVKGALKGLIRDDQIEACVKRVEVLQDYLRNKPKEQIIDSFDQISENHKNAYKFDPNYAFIQNYNIYSQIKNASGANQSNLVTSEMGPLLLKDESGHETSIISKYVARKLGKDTIIGIDDYGLHTNTLACFVVPRLMHMLSEAAQADDFDLKKLIENGELDKMFEEAKALAVVDKEKDDAQKKQAASAAS